MRDGHKNKNRVRIIQFIVSTRSTISRCSEADAVKHVNTTPQMTSFRGANHRVHKIATGKSYDELLQHDNKMRISTRSENSEKWKIYGLVTKHNVA